MTFKHFLRGIANLPNRITEPVPFGLAMVNWIMQRIFRINGNIKWPVHFTNKCTGEIVIGKNVWISFAVNGNCYIQGGNGIFIGDNTIFAPGVKIISANHDPMNLNGHIKTVPIKIGKNCWIGTNAVILPGVEIGDCTIIGAGAIVTHSFPENVIIAGNPAKILKKRNEYAK